MYQKKLSALYGESHFLLLADEVDSLSKINLDKGVSLEDLKEWADRFTNTTTEFVRLLDASGIRPLMSS